MDLSSLARATATWAKPPLAKVRRAPSQEIACMLCHHPGSDSGWFSHFFSKQGTCSMESNDRRLVTTARGSDLHLRATEDFKR